MAQLTGQGRKRIADDNFVFPPKRDSQGNITQEGRYPIHDAAHARAALSRVMANGTSAEQAAVKRAVCAKYPNMGQCREKK